MSADSMGCGTHIRRVLHHVWRERSIDDEVTVVGDDGSCLHFTHSQAKSWLAIRQGGRRAHGREIVKDLGVGERCDLDRDPLRPL